MKKERTKSQIAKGSRNKGKKAENEVAKLLGLWFFGDISSFHRVPSSGALRWKSDVARTRGDIVCSADQNFPYSIEVKNQEGHSWDLLSILLNEGPIVNKWWIQCLEDSEAVGKLPWLIFTRNNVPFISMNKRFDGHYLKDTEALKTFRWGLDTWITPLASLLYINPTRQSNLQIENLDAKTPEGKIINRHFINVLKRIKKND